MAKGDPLKAMDPRGGELIRTVSRSWNHTKGAGSVLPPSLARPGEATSTWLSAQVREKEGESPD